MLKAVVFDDEHIVLKGLETMIDWAGFGITLAGTATDGYAAIDLVHRVRPDIVLTDIRMPGMDGLQLIEQVLREAPETYCIVFSGYNEFEYVKRAIQLGVADYLEKPITVPGIEEALRKMSERIGQKRRCDRELLEKATLDLLLIGEDAAEAWRTRIGTPTAERIVCTTVLASSGDVALPEAETYRVVRAPNGQERYVAVFHFQPPSHEFWELLEQAADSSSVTIGVGRTVQGYAGAAESRRDAQRALRAARFLGERLVRSEELGEAFAAVRELNEREEAIIWHLRTGNRAGLTNEIDGLIAWFQAEKPAPETVESEMLKLIYLAREVARELGAGEPSGETGDGAALYNGILLAAAEGKLEVWFRDQMERIADRLAASRGETKHDAVERAVRYIEQNVSRDLSLQEVAEHVGMNAAYLSVLFKEVMGETYIRFLTRKRVELAKQLLARGMKVNEVSQRVGYHTYRHFCDVFKKYTGRTPGQFRDG